MIDPEMKKSFNLFSNNLAQSRKSESVERNFVFVINNVSNLEENLCERNGSFTRCTIARYLKKLRVNLFSLTDIVHIFPNETVTLNH